jgi:hypothetical protein
LHGVDFDHLVTRTQAQHARLEEHRLEAARTVLCATPKESTPPNKERSV